ncbi:MAG TPA: HD domain-containing phosphohydrolase [Candidatus Udaeobacter sp.]|jgi:signal transduction histidine kinase/HD-GYP domain-containing protein (c-di-GMP phosphodiesterase class II)|nr:HD domain-containing phosphohydrolase [Candidatus Udaeobacter sp.]
MSLALSPQPGPEEVSPAETLSVLAQVLLALRSTADLGAACAIAGASAVDSLGASDYRLLRVDARSGALRAFDEAGAESSYLAQQGGPVEQVMRLEVPSFDPGTLDAEREDTLWLERPAALATLPLLAGGAVQGVLLVAFDRSRTFTASDRLFLLILADSIALTLERDELRRLLREERHRGVRLERRINETEESSSSLMSVVAHEIRTPLTAIKAYTEAMIDNLANPHAPRERFLGIINDECDRLTRLVSDILDLSRLEAGQRPLRLGRLNLQSLVHETLEGLEPVATARKVQFDVDVEATLTPEGDPDLLRRLLINLVGNAVKFSPISGRVKIHSRTRGDEWLGVVEDEGPGIPTEDLPRVFERFYRVPRPGTEQVEGTGLGLAIARGIVELHGGRIWAQSVEPTGTRFCFTLPVRQLASTRARRIARLIWNRIDLRELFDHTIEMVAAAMDAEIVSLMLVDPDQGDLFIASSRGLEGQNLLGRRTSVRSGVAGSVAAWGRPLLVNNIETDRRFRRLNHPQYSTKSLLCAPLRIQGEVLGVFNVNNKNSGDAFDSDDLSVLAALIERVASAVERAIAHPDSARIVTDSVEAVKTVTRLKREYLLGQHDVVHLTRALAHELGMSESEVDLLGYVASIHDLGMLRVPGHGAPGPLEPAAIQDLERHPEVSMEILRPLEYLAQVRDIILSHHEHWGGGGYPRGLVGEAIPIGGRVVAVVDAFESMTRGRSYRAPKSRAEALAELRREAGRQFDPRVVEAFGRVLEREQGTS